MQEIIILEITIIFLSGYNRDLRSKNFKINEKYSFLASFNYTMPVDGMVQVSVYDISGRMVAELVNGYMSAGTYPVTWDANNLSSGLYMLQMISADFRTLQKVMLIK